jgi:hypothetical protein
VPPEFVQQEEDDPTIALGPNGETVTGRLWSGRSAAGIVDIPLGMSPEDECAMTLAKIEEIDHAIRARYPAVGLGTSLTSTAISIFRLFLQEELLVDPQVEVSLRLNGAVGGGRQEMYVPSGSVFEARERVDSLTGEVTWQGPPVDLDLGSAYPTALERVPIGAAFAKAGGPSSYADPCTLSLCLVEVPHDLPIAPLRYNPMDDKTTSSCYPTGLVFGLWSSLQLRVAEKLGAKVQRVHTTWCFQPDDAFRRFGDEMRAWRKELGNDDVARACKQIAVRGIGAWLMSPRTSEIVVGSPSPERLVGARCLGHHLYELEVPQKQHQSSLLPAGVMTTNAVQAWSAWALANAAREGAEPIYWHTDGGAVRHGEALGRAMRRSYEEGRDVLFPEVDRWKFHALKRFQIWAPGQRHETTLDGVVRIAGSGISRELNEDEVLTRAPIAEEIARLDLYSSGRRGWKDGVSCAPRVKEIDPEAHAIACASMGRKEK